MRFKRRHNWELSAEQAIALQEELAAGSLRGEPPALAEIKLVAGTYATFSPDGKTAYGAAVVVSLPELEVVEKQRHIAPVPSKYEPGLLAFSIGPALCGALEKLRAEPDVLMCWGHGRAHPRRIGLATHLGIIFNRPSVGVAIRLLWGTCAEPGPARGARSPIFINGEHVGFALRTRDEVNPLLVSPGYRMDMETACELVLRCCRGLRLPEPLRHARSEARILRHAALEGEHEERGPSNTEAQ